jgi:hypothetical protein
MLKSFHPFAHIIEPAVRVVAFKQYGQWDACQQKSKDEFEKCIQGKREDPSKNQYDAGSNRKASVDEYRGYYADVCSRDDNGRHKSMTLRFSKLAKTWPDT